MLWNHTHSLLPQAARQGHDGGRRGRRGGGGRRGGRGEEREEREEGREGGGEGGEEAGDSGSPPSVFVSVHLSHQQHHSAEREGEIKRPKS